MIVALVGFTGVAYYVGSLLAGRFGWSARGDYVAVLLGVLGIASGLGTGSQAMIFDGMYSFVDVVPTIVSLLVVKSR